MSSLSFSVRRDHFIESSKDRNIFLRLREVVPESINENACAVLFVHGAVVPSAIFDIPVKGVSWLEFFASKGACAFALDLRGYGQSTKPKGMDLLEKEAPMICTHAEALCDIADAIAYIRNERKVDQVVLVGLSWGGLLAGTFTHQSQHLISHLILLGPIYCYKNPIWSLLTDPKDPSQLNASIGGYRFIPKESLGTMWDYEIPFEDKSLWRDPDVYRALEEEVLQSDSDWADRYGVKGVRSPCGVLEDVVKAYNSHYFYPAEGITVPTLIVRGDHDASSHPDDMANLFKRLGSKVKHYVQIGNASHYALAERRASYLMVMVHGFIKGEDTNV